MHEGTANFDTFNFKLRKVPAALHVEYIVLRCTVSLNQDRQVAGTLHYETTHTRPMNFHIGCAQVGTTEIGHLPSKRCVRSSPAVAARTAVVKGQPPILSLTGRVMLRSMLYRKRARIHAGLMFLFFHTPVRLIFFSHSSTFDFFFI